jgi:hypothetical protein
MTDNAPMAIIMSFPLTTPEIRVLQEFRRIGSETMTAAAISAIKHPAGGGEAPARTLVEKGYMMADPSGQSFTLTEKGKEFLKLDPVPEFETGAATDESAAE